MNQVENETNATQLCVSSGGEGRGDWETEGLQGGVGLHQPNELS